ncbi:Uncharacterised protein [Chlamydia trachomatis]|nr:Uncharacterised protein [Chlamydia trachomatis]
MVIANNVVFLFGILTFHLVKSIEDKGRKGCEIGQLKVHVGHGIVNPRETEQVRNHPHHSVGFIQRNLDKARCHRIIERTLIQCFQVGLNRSQGGSQFVTDIGYKKPAFAFFLGLLCHIVQDNYQT